MKNEFELKELAHSQQVLLDQQHNNDDVADEHKSSIINFVKILLKIIGLLFCLYLFAISLDLMSSAFQVLAGRHASEVLSNSYLFKNPIAGLMIGVTFTVLVQSSSTSTSIIVSMVGAGSKL